ncbi:GNAT family N-acetyltransferase [Nocardia sp. CC201C]|uniref:GNAT family N-acetyltransferase n=1 Tax=Nocardia sp. CC201C TaxID=3044575 RepID=UPI0024A8D447|nr:GNAT family N-acetyltransferase [Nocardia sp. CC201C]
MRDDALDVRRLTAEDWKCQRELTFRSIADAPWAFKTTLEQASARTEQEWRALVELAMSRFVATRDGKPVGSIGTVADPERSDTLEIAAVWVAPEARGSGASDRLLHAQLQWVHDNGYRRAVLWARQDNAPMRQLAERHGFAPTGRTRDSPGGNAIPTVEMSRDLS